MLAWEVVDVKAFEPAVPVRWYVFGEPGSPGASWTRGSGLQGRQFGGSGTPQPGCLVSRCSVPCSSRCLRPNRTA